MTRTTIFLTLLGLAAALAQGCDDGEDDGGADGDADADGDAAADGDADDDVDADGDVDADADGEADSDSEAEPCVRPEDLGVEYAVREEPHVDLPAAGGTFVDPTFGTEILRVTDGSSGGDSFHAYSYWPAFNAGSTRLHLSKNGSPTLYDFDPDAFVATEAGPLLDGTSCAWEDSSWSHADPDVLYCHSLSPRILYALDVTTGEATLVHDFEPDLGGGPDEYLAQMLVSKDDDVFTFHTREESGGRHRAIAYVRSSESVAIRDYAGAGLDETHVDGAGRYIVVHLADTWDVWDHASDAVVTVHRTAEERGGLCHQTAGSGIYVGGDCWDTGFLVRRLDDPLHFRHLVSFYQPDGATLEWGYDVHLSINQTDERWFVSSIYSPADDGLWSPWEQEIVAVAIDGSFVMRLAHHHSDSAAGGYWASPRASVSYDGRFIVFTSAWDGGSMDVFVLRMPRICS